MSRVGIKAIRRQKRKAAMPGPGAGQTAQAFESAMAQHRAGDLAGAEAAYRLILRNHPNHPGVLQLLGVVASQGGHNGEAVELIEKSISLNPDNAAAQSNLGVVLNKLDRNVESANACRAALRLEPDNAESLYNLGNALIGTQQPALAAASYRRALKLKPDYAEAMNNLGSALMACGDLEEAAAACRRSLELMPDTHAAHSSLLYCMNSAPGYSAAEILAESRRWDERHAKPLMALAQRHANVPDPDRRLRVGYVSPDFRTHAVSYFFEPLMAAHDPDQVELFCYAEIVNPDATTARYQERSEHWRPTIGMRDHEVAEQVRADGIDILVDLAGHTAGNRLLVFAEHPAPVQVNHLVGYGQTTGMSAMDYLLTDAWMTPAGSDTHYSETPYRLERCFLSFQPLSSWPEVTPSPARAKGYVTFGSLNSPSRITPGTVESWARILKQTEGSRLLMVHGFFRDKSIRRRLLAAFDAHGLADRVSFDAVERGWPAGMDIYENLDIALDTFPMASATTTAIALWMGLPVITIAGEAVHMRFGMDIVSAVGAGEWVATDADSYVSRALALAEDTDRLAELRVGLRARMAVSPLLDHIGLARSVEAAYRDIWRRWCEGGSIRGRMRSM